MRYKIEPYEHRKLIIVDTTDSIYPTNGPVRHRPVILAYSKSAAEVCLAALNAADDAKASTQSKAGFLCERCGGRPAVLCYNCHADELIKERESGPF
jgi:hypothetical protein